MKVLYLGQAATVSTSQHRAQALRRLGHEVAHEDPYAALGPRLRGRLRGALHHRSGYRFLPRSVGRWIDALVQRHAGWPDLVWVNGGELIGRAAAMKLRQLGRPIVLYNNDDPTGGRDGRRFDSLLSALPIYDLCVVPRQPAVADYYQYGARSVHRVFMSYDEVAHHPFADVSQIAAGFQSEVAFVGTWMPEENRDQFLLALAERQVPLAIWGDAWEKSPGWPRIKPFWRGPSIYGRDYVAAIQGAKLALGLLSKGNRDQHTTRSVEIPYAGGLLCAERTSEHAAMYQEGEEAIFWANADECATACHQLLANPGLREQIRRRGKIRAETAGFGNEVTLHSILQKAMTLK
jgi:hypothetical protein